MAALAHKFLQNHPWNNIWIRCLGEIKSSCELLTGKNAESYELSR